MTAVELLDKWLGRASSLLLMFGMTGMLVGRYLRALK